jgi:hypothetical protein
MGHFVAGDRSRARRPARAGYWAAVDWLWWLGAVAIVAWVIAIVDMIRRRGELSRGQLSAWVLIVIIFPVLGTILYFVLGRKPAV